MFNPGWTTYVKISWTHFILMAMFVPVQEAGHARKSKGEWMRVRKCCHQNCHLLFQSGLQMELADLNCELLPNLFYELEPSCWISDNIFNILPLSPSSVTFPYQSRDDGGRDPPVLQTKETKLDSPPVIGLSPHGFPLVSWSYTPAILSFISNLGQHGPYNTLKRSDIKQ